MKEHGIEKPKAMAYVQEYSYHENEKKKVEKKVEEKIETPSSPLPAKPKSVATLPDISRSTFPAAAARPARATARLQSRCDSWPTSS